MRKSIAASTLIVVSLAVGCSSSSSSDQDPCSPSNQDSKTAEHGYVCLGAGDHCDGTTLPCCTFECSDNRGRPHDPTTTLVCDTQRGNPTATGNCVTSPTVPSDGGAETDGSAETDGGGETDGGARFHYECDNDHSHPSDGIQPWCDCGAVVEGFHYSGDVSMCPAAGSGGCCYFCPETSTAGYCRCDYAWGSAMPSKTCNASSCPGGGGKVVAQCTVSLFTTK